MFRPLQLKPAQILDLGVWKVGLPTTQEIKQPHLESYSGEGFAVVTAVQFTAHAGDTAQQGSKYARSELREMNKDGSNASWSSTSGTHTMDLDLRITHLPAAKPQLVCAQIHSSDYLVLVELDKNKLYVRYHDDIVGILDPDYQLGLSFHLRVQAGGGFTEVFHNGVQQVHHPMNETGCYFKAGCYVQSNTSTGDQPTAYGQVEISSLTVAHTA